jgi:hypothetical protein
MRIGQQLEVTYIVPVEEPLERTVAPVPIAAALEPEGILTPIA